MRRIRGDSKVKVINVFYPKEKLARARAPPFGQTGLE
jgi:hypothetical protein